MSADPLPFEAPRELPSSQDDDLEALGTTPLAKFGGGALIFSGVISGLLALQTALSVRFAGVVTIFVPLFFLLAGGLVASGVSLTRMRGWAAVAGGGFGGLGFLVSLVWLVVSFMGGLFSLLALGLVPLTVTSAALAAASIGVARRADAARARLREQGMEGGF